MGLRAMIFIRFVNISSLHLLLMFIINKEM